MPSGRLPKYKTEEERRAAHAIMRREWNKNNPERVKETRARYRERNREKMNKYNNEYQKRRYKNDPEFKKRVIEATKRYIKKNPERFKRYQRIYSRVSNRYLRYPKSNLLRWITNTNTRIVELETEIKNRKLKSESGSPSSRIYHRRAILKLQESLNSITSKRDNYEQLFKKNFIDNR